MSIPAVPPLCMFCKHYVPWDESPSGEASCKAFPGRIPDEILRRAYDHRKPLYNEATLFGLSDGWSESVLEEWEREALEIEKTRLLIQLERFHGSQDPS